VTRATRDRPHLEDASITLEISPQIVSGKSEVELVLATSTWRSFRWPKLKLASLRRLMDAPGAEAKLL